jgi:cob(I)alamin adenosyltransferase
MKGFIQVYTGNGKGKTTAAIGLAIRAAGAGLHVFIAQFVKGMKTGELESLKKLESNITIKQYGFSEFVKTPEGRDIELAANGISDVKEAILSGEYDVVILDEANIAVDLNLCPVEDIINILDLKPENIEIIITGRNAHPLILERADLITEMKEIKHYYNKDIQARKGIEK